MDPFLRAGTALLLLVIIAGLLGPVVWPGAGRLAEPFQHPSIAHPLGTDDLGNDVFAGVLAGARTSLLVAVAAGLISASLGAVAGGLAGSVRALDAPIMRAMDLLLVIPRLPLIIFLSLFLRPSVWNVIVLLSLFGWPAAARVLRPVVRDASQAEFVAAARSLGAGRRYILQRHLLPQAYGVWAALCILEARYAVMAEAGLAFLGLENPGTKSWGMMLAFAFNHQATFISQAWQWTVLPPALAITILMLALTLSAAGLETAFNPRLRAAHLAKSAAGE